MSPEVLTSRLHFAVALCAALSCGKSEAVDRRGEVVALSGTATAQRGDGEPRPLAVGDEVRGEDRVRTGDGAEIQIRLAHNGVVLVYDANADVVLGSQKAWTASGKVGSSVLDKDPDDKTTAAGVHSENEAADDPNAAGSDRAAETAAADEFDDDGDDGASATSEKPDQGAGPKHRDPRKKGGSGKKTGGGGGNDDDPLAGLDLEPKTGKSGKLRVSARSADGELQTFAARILGRVKARLQRCADGALRLSGTLRFAGGRVKLEIAELSGAPRACVVKAFARIKVPETLSGSATISVGQ